MDFQNSDNQANALLQNGILVATNKGVVCMSLTDALSSNLNLSVEDLKTVAQQLILQEQVIKKEFKEEESPYSSEVQHIQNDEQTRDNRITLVECSSIQTDAVGIDKEQANVLLPGPNENWNISATTNIKRSTQAVSPSVEINKVPVKRMGNTLLSNLAIQQLINEFEESSPYSSEVQQISSDATVDSDEQTLGNKIVTALKSSIVQTNAVDSCKGGIIGLSEPIESQNISDSDTNSITVITYNNMKGNTQTASPLVETNKVPPKRRGGWPKGRKRKPELLHLPPKAPATGYNLYLNDMRKQFKDSTLAFHEITKIIGNKWSSLSLEQKQPYLERAEEDKRRYREELRVYRQSGAYQLYLAKKRKKRVQNNVLSESDMDATDDIDDEDNEELYCRTCDQWFHNLHNKREHLQGRQHVQAVVGDMRSEFGISLKKFNLDAAPATAATGSNSRNNDGMSVSECMANLISTVTKREKEIKTLKMRVEEAKAAHDALYQQLHSLKERETTLRNELNRLHNLDREMEIKLFQLWKVPSLFITTDLSSGSLDGSEYLTDE
ncbi:hypothetical protein ILUMI_07319 [Ignelater luminosus]|uniref:HMG box domain-containing protein n=1 Tax=Ignelater luminosus TaxID=2038154 RepID=A0A8K0GGZ4_IGNLU|nr:hypothetical protein ILUMI_07319 [Ignelater luminosus]